MVLKKGGTSRDRQAKRERETERLVLKKGGTSRDRQTKRERQRQREKGFGERGYVEREREGVGGGGGGYS